MHKSDGLRKPTPSVRPRRDRHTARQPWAALVATLIVAYALFLMAYRLADALAGVASTVGIPATVANWIALTATFEPFLLLPLIPSIFLVVVLRARWVGLILSLAALPFILFYAPLFLPNPPALSSGPTLTVMTHNILGANQQGERLSQEILAENPDLVALQELIANHANRLAPQLSQRYPYRVIYNAQGLGLYSRYPLRDAQLLTLAPESSYAIRAIMDAPSGPVTIFNAHPRNPRIEWDSWGGSLVYVANFDPSRRDRAVATLAQALERVQGPVIVLGDLNLPDRSASYRLLTRQLSDAHREAGWGLGYTFPAARPDSRFSFFFPVLRIDYVLYSSGLRALETWVGAPAGSDHRSVVARLAVQN